METVCVLQQNHKNMFLTSCHTEKGHPLTALSNLGITHTFQDHQKYQSKIPGAYPFYRPGYVSCLVTSKTVILHRYALTSELLAIFQDSLIFVQNQSIFEHNFGAPKHITFLLNRDEISYNSIYHANLPHPNINNL